MEYAAAIGSFRTAGALMDGVDGRELEGFAAEDCDSTEASASSVDGFDAVGRDAMAVELTWGMGAIPLIRNFDLLVSMIPD